MYNNNNNIMTVADTFATSYINHTVTLAGAAAERAALNKHAKYEHFKNNYIFILWCFSGGTLKRRDLSGMAS